MPVASDPTPPAPSAGAAAAAAATATPAATPAVATSGPETAATPSATAAAADATTTTTTATAADGTGKPKRKPRKKRLPKGEQECHAWRKSAECPKEVCVYMHACLYCKSTEHGSRSSAQCDEAKEGEKKREAINAERECYTFADGRKCEREICSFMHACKYCKSTEHGSQSTNACEEGKKNRRRAQECHTYRNGEECKKKATPEGCSFLHACGICKSTEHSFKKCPEKKQKKVVKRSICEVCNVHLQLQDVAPHMSGTKHKKKVAQAQRAAGKSLPPKPLPPKPPTEATELERLRASVRQLEKEKRELKARLRLTEPQAASTTTTEPPATSSTTTAASTSLPKNQFTCDVCQISVNSKVMMDNHIGGMKHKKKSRKADTDLQPATAQPTAKKQKV